MKLARTFSGTKFKIPSLSSFSDLRQVRAIQHGRVIFSAMVSFANPEEGLNYQHQEPE
jgi:acyl-CoA thioesterase